MSDHKSESPLFPSLYNTLIMSTIAVVREEIENDPDVTDAEIAKKLKANPSKKKTKNDGKVPDIGKLATAERDDDLCWHIVNKRDEGLVQCSKTREDAFQDYDFNGMNVFFCKAHSRYNQAKYVAAKSSAVDTDYGINKPSKKKKRRRVKRSLSSDDDIEDSPYDELE